MKRKKFGLLILMTALTLGMVSSSAMADEQNASSETPIVLKTMGSILFGGSVETRPDGDTFHGDHGYAQFFVPQNSRTLPMVMWHGIGQHGKTFETTPDGRDGYMQIMPRRDWSVYIIDQPRRGRAGRTLAKNTESGVPTTLKESSAWNAFRLGLWVPPATRTFFPNINFPKDDFSIDQFWRQQTPDTGEEPKTAEHRKFMAQTVGELFKQIGPVILITHSNSGQYGWATAMENPDSVKAVIAYEPGACAFPEGELPPAIPAGHPLVDVFQAPQPVPMEEFKKLTQMPILIVFGDNVAKTQTEVFNSEVWRVAKQRAEQFVEAVNRHGGDATLIDLPSMGITGNTHVPFADLNNIVIADQLSAYLKEKGLDGYDAPHTGPKWDELKRNSRK